MTVLTTIPNGAQNKDIRDTWNQMLADIATLKAGGGTAPLPTVTLSAAQSHNEGNSGATLFTYTVTRSSSTGAVAVPWTFAAGSTNAADFTGGTLPAGGYVTMADGVATGTIVISVNGDTTFESDEQFTVTIGLPSGYQAGSAMSATGTIVNDDSSGTPMPSGVVAFFDPASLSGLGNGGSVASWTDSVGGAVATSQTSGTKATYVANSINGMPAVRFTGTDFLKTAGTNVVNTTMNTTEWGIIVVMRNVTNSPNGIPAVAWLDGGGTGTLMNVSASGMGFYPATLPITTDMRTMGFSTTSGGQGYQMGSYNGTCMGNYISGKGAIGGQLNIGGGWSGGAGATCDVLGVYIFNRPPTAADFKQAHRRWCEKTGQARPGGTNGARNVTFLGDSITAGAFSSDLDKKAYPYLIAQNLGWDWGTWDKLAVIGGSQGNNFTPTTIPLMGNVSGVTGQRTILAYFEWANYRGSAPDPTVAVINQVKAQETSVDLVIGTSTDFGYGGASNSGYEDARDTYDAYFDVQSHRTTLGIADNGYVAIHTDPNIGQRGKAPTVTGGNTYFANDDPSNGAIHLTDAGYAVLASLFQPAVTARLAAA